MTKATASCFDGECSVGLSKDIAETHIPGSTWTTDESGGNGVPRSKKLKISSTKLTRVGPPRGARVALEVLLIIQYQSTALEAFHMEMWAEKANKRGEFQTWSGFLGGHKSCLSMCS